jgi:hypothetical protein
MSNGGRFPHLPDAPEQKGFPVRGLFPAPGKEHIIYSPVKIEVFHILLPKYNRIFDKIQGKNEL